MSESFIELHRTFHLSIATRAKSDDVDLNQLSGPRGQMTWADLLMRPRVVILSGGGSGKTVEIRHRAKRLHAEGRPAFVLRIEHASLDFASAFDKAAGSHEQFEAWVKSGDEGWVFLDSVDEARLFSPKHFEHAISAIGRLLMPVLQQAHIVITGREAAWRARTDRELIRAHMPYEPARPIDEPVPSSDLPAPYAGEADPVDIDVDEEVDDTDAWTDGTVPVSEATRRHASQAVESNAILIVGFDTLDRTQIETFVSAKGVSNVPEFMKAVDRKEAQSDSARPLDLEGLVDFWRANGRIGSQAELTEASIRRRLYETDPDRAEATTLTKDQLRQGAGALAAACTLMQTPEIRLQGASADLHGVEPAEILSWSETDLRTLLLRPLFAGSQFGAVRLHVQKAREFLTAEWLNRLLEKQASRSRIAALFFRVQYGQQVVVPAMRGVLPWLAILNADVLERVRRDAPEVMFEGGDPSRLPLAIRQELLSKACAQLAGQGGSSLTDFQAVQRFAAPDLANHINTLLGIYRTDNEVAYFLMRMVWQGEIAGALDEAMQFAISATAYDVRLISLRAVAVLGTEADHATVRNALLSGQEPVEREFVAEVIETLPKDASGVSWLLEACVRVGPAHRYRIDHLSDAIQAFIADLPMELLPLLVAGLQVLLAKPADNDNDDLDEAEDENDQSRLSLHWLIGAAIAALCRLIASKDAAAFDAPAIALLLRIPAAVHLGDHEDRSASARLGEHVGMWESLNRALFWADVERTRARWQVTSGRPLVDIWDVGNSEHFWRLTAEDFDYIEQEIGERPLLDDRLVALSAAYALYRGNDRNRSWRKRMERRAAAVPELKVALASMLGPQTEQLTKARRQQARWKLRSARETKRLDAHRKQWRKHLQENLESLRTPYPGGGVRQNQQYLSQRMREFEKKSSRWTEGKWRSLIPEFGIEVAQAFRDGAVAFWRTNTPELRSTGAEANSTPLTTIFGLTGLMFEARETPNWAAKLSADEAELATRYAVNELNGFPPWLSALFSAHPDSVMKVVLGEIDHELDAAVALDCASHYVLSDVCSVGRWLWHRLAPELIQRMNSPLASAAHLREVLSILAGSEIEGTQIAALASAYATSNIDELSAVWFAAWIGVDSGQALPALTARLEALSDRERQIKVAMQCLIALTGGRYGRRVAREGYRTVAHLTTLFLLMHRYIVEDEDLQRAGQGVYSPNLRDDAQDARNGLLATLRDMPGPEVYFALQRIAAEHPSKRGREWVTRLARARAVADADRPGWQSSQVREFQESLERTPGNPLELHELAIDRLTDFKHDLEDGETSIAEVLQTPEETAIRNVVANWCREKGVGRYVIAQEEEFADKKRTDFRFHGKAFEPLRKFRRLVRVSHAAMARPVGCE